MIGSALWQASDNVHCEAIAKLGTVCTAQSLTVVVRSLLL
jgi:hypothetical protein